MTAQEKYTASLLSVFSTFLDGLTVSPDLALLTTEKFVVFITTLEKKDRDLSKNWSTDELEKFILAQNVPDKSAFLMRKFVVSYEPYEVDVYLHDFLSSLKSYKKSNSTVKNYKSDIQQFTNSLHTKKIKNLFDPENLKHFVQDQINNQLKPSTIKRKLSSISQFALWAETEEIVADASFWISDIENLVSGKPVNQIHKTISQPITTKQKATTKVLEDFLISLEVEGHSEATIKNYKSDLSQYFEFTRQSSLEKIIAVEEIKDFSASQRKLGLKPNSVKRKITSISQFALWAENRKLVHGVSQWIHQLPTQLFETKPVQQTQPPVELKLNPVALVHAHNQDHKQKTQKNTKSWSLPVPKFASSQSVKAHHTTKQSDLSQKTEENKNVSSTIKTSLNNLAKQVNTKRNQKFLPLLNLAMMILFAIGLAFLGYQQFIEKTPAPLAFPTSPVRPNRELSFQGRLTDTAQNPITTATNMAFRLYDTGPGTGGTLLWNSGTCSITPDQDGIFNVGLGDDCGTEITDDVFTENANVWLEVEIASETLTPRQSIKTVPYALNSETVQGYPISATGAATTNTILVMDAGGQVLLGEVSPILRSTTGTFSIEAQTLSLQTSSGSNGDIFLSPDGTGTVIVQSDLDIDGYIHSAGATLSATYAGGTALVTRAGPSGTANIQEWQTSAGTALSVVDENGNFGIGTSSPGSALAVGATSQFAVNSTGAITAATGIVSSGNIDFSSLSAGGLVRAASTTGRLEIASAGTDYEVPLTFENGLTRSTNTVRLGGTLMQDTSIAQAGFNFAFTGSGNVGIGSTTPGVKLDVVGNTRITGVLNLTSAFQANGDAGTSGYLLTSSGGGVNTWTDPSTLSASSLWTNTANVYHPSNEYASIIDLVVGGTSTASADIQLFANGGAVFNEQGNNVNFRIESDTNANAFFLQGSDGNVGIGTSTPADALAVEGSIRSSALTAGGILSAAAGTGQLQIATAGTDYEVPLTFENGLTRSTNTVRLGGTLMQDTSIAQAGFNFAFTGSGNVGIGSTTPGVKLDVVGNTRITGVLNLTSAFQANGDAGTSGFFLTSSGGGANTWTDPATLAGTNWWANTLNVLHARDEYASIADLVVGGTSTASADIQLFANGGAVFNEQGNNVNFRIESDTNANAFFLQGSDGNVGIGTSTTAYKLEVVHNANALTGFRTTNTTNSTTAATSFGMRTSSAEAGLSLFSANWAASGLEHFANRMALITNIATPPDGIDFVSSAGTGDIRMYAGGYGTTDEVLRITASGNVGIGSTTPGAKLDVAGNTRITGVLNLTSAFQANGDAGTSGFFLTSSGGGANTWTDPATLAGTNWWDNTLNVLHARNEYASIADLVVGGTSTASANIQLFSNGGAVFNEQGNDADFRIESDINTNAFFLQGSDSNIGIGTSTPVANIHIFQASPTANQILFQIGTSDNANRFTVDEDGDGNFNGNATARSFYAGNGTFTGPSHSFLNDTNTGMYRPAADTLGFVTNSAERLTIDSNGNVGIGSLTPGYALDLVGEFNLTDAIRVAGDAGTSGFFLTSSGGGANTWTDPATLAGTNWWENTLNILHARDEYASIVDLVVGGTSTASANIQLFSNGGAVFNEQGNNVNFRIESDTDINAFFLQGSDGNIGIGTSTPQQLFHVHSGTLDSVATFRSSDDTARIDIRDNDTTGFFLVKDGYFSLGGTNTLSTNNININITTGQVGIGTITPGYALDLVGEFNLTDAIRVAGDAGTSGYLLTSSGGGANTWTDPATVGTNWWANTLNVLHARDEYASIADLVVGGTSTASANIQLYADGSAVFNEQGNNVNFRIESDTDINALFLQGSDGNIGIGTNTPGAKLQVAGNIFPTTDDTYTLGSDSLRWADLYLGPASLHIGTSGDEGIIGYNTTDDYLSFDSDADSTAEMVVTAGGNVGIGSLAPAAALDVIGSIRSSALTAGGMLSAAAGTGQLQIATAGTDYEVPLTFENGLTRSTNTVRLGGALTQDTEIPLAGFDLSFTGDGTVGIATQSAIHKFEVNSSQTGKALVLLKELGDQDILTASNSAGLTRFRMANTGFMFAERFSDVSNGQYYLDPAGGTTSMAVLSNVGIGTTTPGARLDVRNSGTEDILNLFDGGTEVLTVIDGGNVGIGTTAPGAILHVPSGATDSVIIGAATGRLRFTGAGGSFARITYETASGDWHTGALGDANYRLRFGSTDHMIVESGGNVGIGTTSPTSRLHITGGAAAFMAETGSEGRVSISTPNGEPGIVFNAESATQERADIRRSETGLSILASTSNSMPGFQSGIFVANGGNVGIGTNIPGSYKLNVQGNQIMNGNIYRSEYNNGFLVGGHNNLGSSSTNTNPIFTIGSSYIPTTTTLGDMYGIGYTHSGASFITGGGAGWGMYVAADGDARIFLNATTGGGYFAGNVGIGTTSVGQRLSVGGSIDASVQFLGQASDTASAPSFSWTGDTNVGIYRPGTDLIGFTTAGAERMRLTSNNLELRGNSANGTFTSPGTIAIKNNAGTGFLSFHADTGARNGYIQGATTSFNIYANANVPMTFGTNGTEKMRIAANGNVGIGTTTTSYVLTVDGTTRVAGNLLVDTGTYEQVTLRKTVANQPGNLAIRGTGGTAPSYADIFMGDINNPQGWLGWSYRTGSRNLGSYYYNGTSWINPLELETDNEVRVNLANTSATTLCHTGGVIRACSSLSKFKDNQQDLSIGLETLMQLRPVEFDWNTNDQKHDLGFIAEEVEAVNPLLAEYDYNTGELSSVKYRMMTSLIVKSVQEQQLMIEDNRTKLQAISSLSLTDDGQVVIEQNGTNYQVTVDSQPQTNLLAAAKAVIANITAGLINTQDLIVQKTASIKNLSVETLTINGQTLADYIASVLGGQVTSDGTALISPLANDTVITIASQSGKIAFTNTQDKQIANLDEEGNLSLLGKLNSEQVITTDVVATGSSTLGSLLVENDATVSGSLLAGLINSDVVISNTTTTTDLTVNQDATVAGTLTANQIDATSTRIAQLEAGMAELQHVKAVTADIMTATVSGTLYANNIYDFENKVATTLQQPGLLDTILGNYQNTTTQDNLDDLYATVNKTEFNATAPQDLDLSLADLSATSDDVILTGTALFVEKYFKVNGAGYISDSLAIGNKLFVGESMTIADGLIQYTTSDPDNQVLQIQPSGQGSIELLAGIVTIDDSGKVVVNGDFEVTGNAKIAGTLLTNSLKPTDFGNPFQVQVAGVNSDSDEVKKSRFEIINEIGTPVATFSAEGNAQFAGKVDIAGGIGIESQDLGSNDNNEFDTNKTSGKATIKSGANEVIIKTGNIKGDTLIYVTAVGSTGNQVLYVKSQTADNPETPEQEGRFVVGFDNAAQSDVSFNWWIVN